MMEFIGMLIWLGGVQAAPDHWGFWRLISWPYQLGRVLVAMIPD